MDNDNNHPSCFEKESKILVLVRRHEDPKQVDLPIQGPPSRRKSTLLSSKLFRGLTVCTVSAVEPSVLVPSPSKTQNHVLLKRHIHRTRDRVTWKMCISQVPNSTRARLNGEKLGNMSNTSKTVACTCIHYRTTRLHRIQETVWIATYMAGPLRHNHDLRHHHLNTSRCPSCVPKKTGT